MEARGKLPETEMATPWFDLLQKAVRENLRVTTIPNVNPEKLRMTNEAVELCIKGLSEHFDDETASLEDCTKIADGMHDVEADLLAIRRQPSVSWARCSLKWKARTRRLSIATTPRKRL
jgi:hypothetical protein